MTKHYSIAEARHKLSAVIRELDWRGRIELTRRGKPVAVMLSMREFERVSTPRRRFWEAYEVFRETANLPELGIDPSVLDTARDQYPDR